MKLHDLYKCSVCGNIVEVEFVGGGELVCCGQKMELLEENSTDAAQEKHVPVIEDKGDSILVKVGEVSHPMEEKHYIAFIEVFLKNGETIKKHLQPGEAPEAEFQVKRSEVEKVREYCNLHGAWIAK